MFSCWDLLFVSHACHRGSWEAWACLWGGGLWSFYELDFICLFLGPREVLGFGETTPLSKSAVAEGLVTSVGRAGTPHGLSSQIPI